MNTEIATLAGGCFWGVEELFRQVPGILNTEVGYTGGSSNDPTYETVSTGKTGHAESLQIEFNSEIISYEKILEFFFKLHDPTTLNQQGNDKGSQYRSAIFYHSEEQKITALKVKESVSASRKWPRPLVTEIVAASAFYTAEAYHQDYLLKNPGGYSCHYIRS